MMYRFLPDTGNTASSSGQQVFYPMMGWYGHPGFNMMYGSWWGGWIMIILWVITWILLVAALIAFIRWMWRKGSR